MFYSEAVSVAPGPEVVSGDLQVVLQTVSGKFGVPFDPQGVCFGFATMASLAFLDTTPDSWRSFLQRIKSICGRISSAAIPLGVLEERADKDFLLLLNIIQSPEKFSEYFKVRDFSSESQATILSNLPALVKLIMDCGERSCLPFSCIFQLLNSAVSACSASGEAFLTTHSLDGIYAPSELRLYFESIQECLTSGRFSIALYSQQHVVSVLYQAPDRFIYADANQGVFPCSGLDELLARVLSGFFVNRDTHYIFMRSKIMSAPGLQGFNPFDRLSSVDKWARVHEKTPEKINLKGGLQWHGAQIAAANGYVDELSVFLQVLSPNHKFKNDIALLNLAAQHGHASIASALCKAGVSADVYDIEIALLNKHEDVAAVILNHLAMRSFNGLLAQFKEQIRVYSAEEPVAAEAILAKLSKEPSATFVNFEGRSVDEVMSQYLAQVQALRDFIIGLMPSESEADVHNLQSYLSDLDLVFERGANGMKASVDAQKTLVASVMTPTTFAGLSLELGGLYEALDSSAIASGETAAYSV